MWCNIVPQNVPSICCRHTTPHIVKIAPIMMSVAGDLEANWAEYDDDAFVNAWDIGNYVADYLMDRVGNEGCGCSAKIYKEEDTV